ncbi:RNA polymerase sporulation sigma factor SigF [Thermoanaerobacterium sp. DL9XJH110]|jgi:RNA polymerase sporulation-specific sigma factor|uniref:RNA polymerase sporulation sigma factor SigF n=1 Tax=Thermoanaerobacterium sp. DL9XJH110 TaxID=3386643 RepID=UPI003BB4B3BB
MDLNRSMELLKRAKQGDKQAKDELVSLNLGLVWSIVKRFNNRGYELEDLFQIGSIGLLKAIEKFDFNYNVRFSTYAVPMIMGEIRRFLRDDSPVKVARSFKEMAGKIQQAREMLIKTLDREPTINELAEETKLSPEEVVMVLESQQSLISLNDIAYQDDGSPIYYIDQIEADEHRQNQWLDRIALKEALAKLSKEERQIIILRYFKDKTQMEVAGILGMTQVQVSRLERKILNKIKELIS